VLFGAFSQRDINQPAFVKQDYLHVFAAALVIGPLVNPLPAQQSVQPDHFMAAGSFVGFTATILNGFLAIAGFNDLVAAAHTGSATRRNISEQQYGKYGSNPHANKPVVRK